MKLGQRPIRERERVHNPSLQHHGVLLSRSVSTLLSRGSCSYESMPLSPAQTSYASDLEFIYPSNNTCFLYSAGEDFSLSTFPITCRETWLNWFPSASTSLLSQGPKIIGPTITPGLGRTCYSPDSRWQTPHLYLCIPWYNSFIITL